MWQSRNTTIISSKLLIESGIGVLTIGKSDAVEFNESYNTSDKEPLKKCLNKFIKIIR